MVHAITMRYDKFKTACEVRFYGPLIKGKKFKHLTRDEVQSIGCETCRAKIEQLRAKHTYTDFKGGRSILIDLPDC